MQNERTDRIPAEILIEERPAQDLAAAIVPDPCPPNVPDTRANPHPRPQTYPTADYRRMRSAAPMQTKSETPSPVPSAIRNAEALPADHPAVRPGGLIAQVTVLDWPQRYNYYQRFCTDAERFYAVRGTPCPTEGYFSYIPQYAQLNHGQLQFYFWFRENARAGTYLDTVDLPYILLYIYEIINLPHRIPAEGGAAQLAGLWLFYRGRHPELDRYLPEWMCDYCLTRGVALPESLHPIIPEILPRATLKEFYISAAAADTLSPAALILAASDYSYRSSRYYEAHREAYDRHIPAAVGHALAACGIVPDPAGMRRVRVERDAFCGSLCAQTVKKRILVEYHSFARSYELRRAVTQAVKLAENFVRRGEKIRSRLNTQDTDPAIQAAVCAYFEQEMPAARRKTEKVPEDLSYEKLYDAPTEGIDFALAHGLEETLAVPDAFLTEEEDTVPPPAPIPVGAEDEPAAKAAEIPFRAALAAVADGGSLTAWCKNQPGRNIPAEVAGAINDYAFDAMGDVVLIEEAGDFILLDDYKEEVLSWLTT